jgi:type II secretory pathway component PulK
MMRLTRFPARDGFVLIAVLAVIVILSLSAYAFTQSMRLEAKAVDMQLRTTQARLVAESGVELTRALLILQRHGLPLPDLDDNPDLFHGISLFDSDEDVHNRLRAQFSVMAPLRSPIGPADASLVRFGLTDESAKLDLIAWARRDPIRLRQTLESSLRLRPEVAAGIIARTLGGQSGGAMSGTAWSPVRFDTYRTAHPNNGPLETIDDLLGVTGMSRDLLYGKGGAFSQPGRADAVSPAGREVALTDFLTIYARASETDHLGRPRIWLNDPDLASLYRRIQGEFGDALARFVVAFRVFGPSGATSTGPPAVGGSNAQLGRYQFTSLTELIGGQVRGTWRGRPVAVTSPISTNDAGLHDRLPSLLDRLTVNPAPVRLGVVNVNSAPEEVLAVLPRLSAAQRSAIVAHRLAGLTSERAARSRGLSWLITERIISLDDFRAIEPLVTDRSEVVRVRSWGYFADRGPRIAIEAVVDGTRNPPEVLSYQESIEPPPRELPGAVDSDKPPRTLPDLTHTLTSGLANWSL